MTYSVVVMIALKYLLFRGQNYCFPNKDSQSSGV